MERTCLTPTYARENILILRILVLSLITLYLSGCSTPKDALPYPLTISEEGLGSIHPNTPFNQLNSSLSGFTFEKLSRVSPDQNQLIFQLKRGKMLIADIVSDSSGKKIAEIQIVSPLIKNKNHQGLGDQLPMSKTLRCKNDLCYYENEPSLHYRIDLNTQIIQEITFSRL